MEEMNNNVTPPNGGEKKGLALRLLFWVSYQWCLCATGG